MTIRDLLETLHCSVKENISFRFYEYKSKKEYVFHHEDEIYSFVNWSNSEEFLNQVIEYFSFSCNSLSFQLVVRIKEGA